MKNAWRAVVVAGALVLAAGWSVSPAVARPPAREGIAQELDLPLIRASLQRVEPVDQGEGVVLVSVALPNGAATMELHRHSIRAAGFTAFERINGQRVPVTDAPETTYRGRLVEDHGAQVVASVIDGQVSATIWIGEDRDPWVVQALSQFDGHTAAERSLHLVYRGSDAIRLPSWCGMDERHEIGAAAAGDGGATPRGPATACMRIAEISYESDFEFFQAYGSTPATIAGVEAYHNQADFIYERDIGISLVISSMTVLAEAPAPDHPYLAGSDVYAVLGAFREYWSLQPDPLPDNAHLMCGRDFGGIAGLAYLPATCNTDGYNTGLTRRYTGDFNSIVVVLAHELGHNMGSPHDNQGGTCQNSPGGFVMNPSVNTTQMAFSPCSVAAMNSYLWPWGGCLERVMPGAPFGRPDSGVAVRGVPIEIDVLPNDLSCETATVQLISPTSAGGAALSVSVGTGWAGTDRIRYTSNAGTPDVDTFTYRAVNAQGQSEPITVTVTNVTPRAPENPASSQPMLDVNFYALPSNTSVLPNFDLMTRYTQSTASNINIASSEGPFADSGRSDDVGALYTGYLHAPTTGLYTLYIESDDGSRLKIGTTTVANNDGLHGMQDRSGQIALAAGWHALRVEFFERGGSAGLIMRWAGPGFSRQVIAPEFLKRDLVCPTDLDNSGATDVPDIFQFLTWWFDGDSRANWDGGPLDVADIFGYLTDWFAAAGPC